MLRPTFNLGLVAGFTVSNCCALTGSHHTKTAQHQHPAKTQLIHQHLTAQENKLQGDILFIDSHFKKMLISMGTEKFKFESRQKSMNFGCGNSIQWSNIEVGEVQMF